MTKRSDGVLEEMRRMVVDSRIRFYALAVPIVGDDPDLRSFAWGLMAAIGEVSPDEALAALEREKDRRA